jgi:AraC-like DNA-binding protein
MIFETYVPIAPLRPFIEFLWFYDGFAPLHTREKLLPDASMELIIDLREHPKRLWDANDPNRATEFRKSWLSGMHTGFIIIDASPGSMMGVHFRPGGARPFFRAPLSEFTNNVVPFECVVGARADALRDHLLAAEPYTHKFAILQAFLLETARGGLVPDSMVSGMLPQVLRSGRLMKELAAEAGVSSRRFIQEFEDQVGLRPKQLQQISRFQRAVQGLHRQSWSKVDWAGVAVECGYYDQAHFINDFQRFSGHTPGDFLRQPREHANYVIMDPLFPPPAGSAAAAD